MRTFPILVSFDGKPPLVTGGGELALVKTRLLLKRAPSVDIAADRVVPEIAALAAATGRLDQLDSVGRQAPGLVGFAFNNRLLFGGIGGELAVPGRTVIARNRSSCFSAASTRVSISRPALATQ